ncbi:hypothetical protein JTB14_013650 [Gonioctena quinquepunctata]|nr:hypothetical protein JTB14_013650 [Gonioctena quinquepunctata]
MAAYNTVWRLGLIYKLIRAIPCKRTTDVLDNMLSNRTFQVIMGNKKSKLMELNKGLPQGSVLAPLLFSFYIADMPETRSRKFGYADDWTLATGHRDSGIAGNTLTSDLTALSEYFRKWRLQPSATKTEVSVFHLNNKMANIP